MYWKDIVSYKIVREKVPLKDIERLTGKGGHGDALQLEVVRCSRFNYEAHTEF